MIVVILIIVWKMLFLKFHEYSYFQIILFFILFKERKKMSVTKGSVMTSMWDYVPKSNLTMSSGDIALPMKKGDKVIVIELCPNEWLKVNLNGISYFS
jgi:hypothetical protein